MVPMQILIFLFTLYFFVIGFCGMWRKKEVKIKTPRKTFALVVAAHNEHAVAFAGFGHRYPTIEVYSTSERSFPWEHTRAERDAMSDLIHAMHAATGADIPCNEEWHYRPIDVEAPMPWRVMLKWRISTLAGFEGATKIYLNTLTPHALRDRVVERLVALRNDGAVTADLRIADEARCRPNALRYASGR